MKRFIIGSLVGAILLFGWQSIAHMFMHHHDPAYKAIANQDGVISTLSTIFKEEGQYLVPRTDPNASQEDMQKYNEAMKGKPWAMVVYHPSYENDMGMAVIRSFITAFFCVALFIWILGRNPGSFLNVFLKSLGLGFLAFMYVYYNQNIWMQTPWEVISGELIDLLVAWGLCGLWLGWWLNRNNNKRVNTYS